jgi:thymidylate synthase ThyX
MIKAEIVGDSLSPQGHRITSFLLTYPRIIHSELMTHRMFSRNSASSRAIPFKRMVESVMNNPFIPIAWQKDHKGMQGTEYLIDSTLKEDWLKQRDSAIFIADRLNEKGVTKQLCNRLLEPFMWHTTLVTATEFDNFFELRNPVYEIDLDNLESLKD